MRPISYFFFVAAIGIFFSSCTANLRPFTQNMVDEYNWSETELKKIQFYLGEDVVLTRELKGGSSEITRGEIRVINGRKVEEIVIRRGTPGVFLFSPKTERLAISFEEGGKERFLVFGPNPKAGERYTLRGSDWNRYTGTVTYDGRKWSVSSQDGFATLMVDLKKLQQIDRNRRVAGGRRVG